MAKLNNNDTAAAAYGRAVLAEEQVAEMAASLAAMTSRVAHMESLVRFLQENIATLTRPRTLLTEKEAAAELRVTLRTMHNWRNERPARIPFILLEGGDVRYRVEVIENYLQSRERGEKKTALRAA